MSKISVTIAVVKFNEKERDSVSFQLSNVWIFDPRNWTSHRTYGVDQLTSLHHLFSEPLSEKNFDISSCLKEWRAFRAFVNANCRGLHAAQLWQKFFLYKRQGFPNLCVIANLVTCCSGSITTVERALSLLSLLLSDRRLWLAHSTLSNLMTINMNDKLWRPQEKEEIVKFAANAYGRAKGRIRKCDDPPPKVPYVDTDMLTEESSEVWKVKMKQLHPIAS